MVLEYCNSGNLRNYYLNNGLKYSLKIRDLKGIASGLLDIHNSGKVHKDFHSEPVNLGAIQSTLFSEGFDCQLDESDLNEMNQDDQNNIE
ncbi:kinase-like domain-containing protein [Rhizophagus irregularis DAOM 181602=DAOM 197198]|nr:kinase-like domain-containing protein [Rhizophagus irregularis DAOM 181602=DAOM 197198]